MRIIGLMLFVAVVSVSSPISAHAADCDKYDECMKKESAEVEACETKVTGTDAIVACGNDIQYHCERLDTGGCEKAYFQKKYGPGYQK